jgi:hypothetical protein
MAHVLGSLPCSPEGSTLAFLVVASHSAWSLWNVTVGYFWLKLP